MVIIPGLVGPKPIPNGGGDGEQVNIPAHQCSPMEGRSAVCTAGNWIPVGALRRTRRQIRVSLLQGGSQGEATAEPSVQSALPRKTSFGLTTWIPYRKPTQVVESRRLRRTSDMPLRNSANKRP